MGTPIAYEGAVQKVVLSLPQRLAIAIECGYRARFLANLTAEEYCDALGLTGLARRIHCEWRLPDQLADTLLDMLTGHKQSALPDERTAARLLAEKARSTGWVYFAVSHDTGHITIGHSRNVERRIAALQTATSGGITCLGVMPGTRRLEADTHQLFSTLRVEREWFKAFPRLLGFIDRWAS